MTNHSNEYLNKGSILERMRRFAASYFGVSQSELLDPIVRLFLESLGEEIYKIANDISDMENRIQDKLSGMLLSDINTIAKPAHTVIHATSSTIKHRITTQTEFYHIANQRQAKNKLTFFPVCNTKVYKGDVRYFIHKGLFYSIDQLQAKTLLTRSGQRDTSSANSFWIGLELDENIDNIKDLSFYIDFDGVYNKEEYLSMLPHCVWKIQDEVIPMRKGIFSIDETYENNTLELFSRYDFSNKVNSSVKSKYDPQYVTINKDFEIREKRELFPDKLQDSYPSHFSEGFTQPLLWIEIACPTGFTSEIIDAMKVCINTFPVANKKLITKTVEFNSSNPIIPLNTGNSESFISICSLIDSSGKQYYDTPINDNQTSQYGTYSLRHGGCERYGVREAREYLINTIDSLKGEASAFFENREDTKAELKKIQLEVNQIIKELSSIVYLAKERYDIENYILIGPEVPNNELFFLEYWTTMGASATIKIGTRMHTESGSPINPASVITLSAAKDGKYAPQHPEKYKQYKKSLTNHNLLITGKDIEQFCLKNFQSSISQVQIRKGLEKSIDTKIGFIKTTDIYLKPRKELEKLLGEQDESYFKQILAENSPATFRYRVFINKKI